MQPFRDVMTKRDRTTLGGLVLAMIVGVGGSLGLAASCLGRDRAHRADDPISAFPEDRSARTSSGGVPGEEAVGQAEITSVELPAGAPATNTAPPAPENAPPPNPNPTPTPQPNPIPSPQPDIPDPSPPGPDIPDPNPAPTTPLTSTWSPNANEPYPLAVVLFPPAHE